MELPPKLEVVWFNIIDEIDRVCEIHHPTNDWKGCSDSVEANIGKTAEQFYQEAPCKAGDFYGKHGKRGFSGDLYIGYVFGRFNNLTLRREFPKLSLGPKNESAMADEFVVLYKNMTMPRTNRGRDISCSWWFKLPQGFSCGKASAPEKTCDYLDTFTPVPCSQIEVKVLGSEAGKCPRRKGRGSITRPSQPHCWAEHRTL